MANGVFGLPKSLPDAVLLPFLTALVFFSEWPVAVPSSVVLRLGGMSRAGVALAVGWRLSMLKW